MQAVFRSGLCAAMILLSACSPKPETTSRQDAAEHGEQSANAKGEQAEKAEKGEAVERGEAAEKEGGEAEDERRDPAREFPGQQGFLKVAARKPAGRRAHVAPHVEGPGELLGGGLDATRPGRARP